MVSLLKTPLSEPEIVAKLAAADSEFLFMLDSAKIPRDVQAKVIGLGYCDATVFGKLEDTAEEARKVFKTDLDLDDTQRARSTHSSLASSRFGRPRTSGRTRGTPRRPSGAWATCHARCLSRVTSST